jgi:hypothetical protein
VEIAPAFGELTSIKAVYPHQLGNIELELRRNGSNVEGSVTVPASMKATFVWGDKTKELRSGKQNFKL